MLPNQGFASDNHSGVHPDIIKAIIAVNDDYTNAYGNDEYTKNAIKKFKEHFGNNIDVFFVYNGTAANILGLKTITDSFNSIICAETAHLNVHECCGPENFIGCKLITIPTTDGKLTIDKIKPHLIGFNNPHRAQPKIISITQPTELGTVYTIEEIKRITDLAHKNNMLVHMDGARLCNASAFLNIKMNEITGNIGVDLLSFGGTKNGMMFGDAVIFFNKYLSNNFDFIRKQGMQLASKMRYISAQFEAYLSNNLWLKNAKHSNEMTQILYNEIKKIPKIRISQKVETNTIIAIIQKKLIPILKQKYFFHIINEKTSEIRWMCSYKTTNEEILRFIDTIRKTII